VIAAGLIGGVKVARLIALPAILEISISFDNAIINASVLQKMAERWQRVFLAWGILIAVFGVRTGAGAGASKQCSLTHKAS
jgi:hypothetical protein